MQAVFVAPPRANLLGQLEGFGAGGLELKLQSARRRFRDKRYGAELVAVGVGDFPGAPHFLRYLGYLRALRANAVRKRNDGNDDWSYMELRHAFMIAQLAALLQLPRHGVSGTGVKGGLPSAQASRLSTTSWSITRRV